MNIYTTVEGKSPIENIGFKYSAMVQRGFIIVWPMWFQLSTAQRITISITRKFVSCNFSMDRLDLDFFGGDDLSFDTYLPYTYKWMIW